MDAFATYRFEYIGDRISKPVHTETINLGLNNKETYAINKRKRSYSKRF